MFQSSFNELTGTADMIKKYTVPKYFRNDFFDLVREHIA
jgi:hypothetical protein